MNDRRVSSLERLRRLDPVITGRQLALEYGFDSAIASQYLWRWSRTGLVRPFGGKSDVFYNLVRDQRWTSHLFTATRYAFPDAVVIGGLPLARAGLTTQPVRTPAIAVPPSAPRYTTHDVVVVTRPSRWFDTVQRHAGVREVVDGLPALAPAWALADARIAGDVWVPDDDDIDWDEFGGETKHIAEATLALRAVYAPRAASRHNRLS